MARPIYSTRFAALAVPAGATTTVYTVPSGFVAILRDVEAIQSGGSSQSFYCEAPLDAGGTQSFVNIVLTPGASGRWSGRIVANAGEQFKVYAGSAGCYAWLTGYLLAA